VNSPTGPAIAQVIPIAPSPSTLLYAIFPSCPFKICAFTILILFFKLFVIVYSKPLNSFLSLEFKIVGSILISKPE
jgi:hypothetical protein